MGNQEPLKEEKRLVIGILAHVDAGKTTLSEGILYETGTIRTLGRVDNKDAYLDTYELERARGITIFSKQAVFSLGDTTVTLLDTPGHVDFSAEMERTLQVLDYAILVISGADGVQGHTETLWRLLSRYQVPTFLFVNKMDQAGTDKEKLLKELQERLDSSCIDFGQWGKEQSDEWWESLAMCDEAVLEHYLETGTVEENQIRQTIGQRKVFPCYFGSAIKLQGVDTLLDGLAHWSRQPVYGDDFAAKVFKIARDNQGNRLTYMKITGGKLQVKDSISGTEDKVNQIRIYSGAKFETVQEAGPGTICAVTGLTQTHPGEGLGSEPASELPILEPVLTYRLEFPEGTDLHGMLRNLKQLEEEEPQLHVVWNEQLEEIQAQVMGEVQIEVLKNLIEERFHTEVEFGTGNIVYKETLLEPVEGVGHFEPLRHYAEVHLLIEPAEQGSGLQFDTDCSEDILDRNWQRLILTHLMEKHHVGVLTGSEITDLKITLLTGKAHQKHTEGGDFRQATYRALRQGLREGKSRLLEPYYSFRLEVPTENVGRAMADLERMQGKFELPVAEGDNMILTGLVPVATMKDYQTEVVAYTRGRGRLSCALGGYFPCHNEEEIIAEKNYDPDTDIDNPTGSVFCAHGAGYVVPWDEVKQYMHVESGVDLRPQDALDNDLDGNSGDDYGRNSGRSNQGKENSTSTSDRAAFSALTYGADDAELEAIFTRTYGESKRNLPGNQGPRRVVYAEKPETTYSGRTPGYLKKQEPDAEEYLLVDGYNILYAWDDLRELMEVTVDGARHRLMDILCNYQGYRNCHLIVVFDAYKVPGGVGSTQDYHNIHVVYTKEAETADQYIEKFAHKMGRKYRVTVATSDGLEQLIIRGQGCILMSAKDLREDVERVGRQIEEEKGNLPKPGKNFLFRDVDEDLAKYLEAIRLGEITE